MNISDFCDFRSENMEVMSYFGEGDGLCLGHKVTLLFLLFPLIL